MAGYSLSAVADAKLASIYQYSYSVFGEAQADRYLLEIQSAFENPVAHPHLGRDVSDIKVGVRRLIHASHSIFYAVRNDRIVILDILGLHQDPTRHL